MIMITTIRIRTMTRGDIRTTIRTRMTTSTVMITRTATSTTIPTTIITDDAAYPPLSSGGLMWRKVKRNARS